MSIPVQLKAWIDCPRCGKFHRLSRTFRLPKGIAGPMQLKIQARCERCGRAEASLYLDRTVSSVH
jgi:ribosomal protein S14